MRSSSPNRTYRRIVALLVAISAFTCGLLLFSPPSRAFKPVHFPGANAGDKTHVAITEEAIKESIEGDGIIPGVTKVSKSMEKAIEQIKNGNKATDLIPDLYLMDEAHFTGDRLAGGQQRIDGLFKNMKAALEADELTKARWALGSIFHAIQDFYAHSNWIETGHSSPNPNVGVFSKTGALLASAVLPNEVACADCASPFSCIQCANNVITPRITTSWFQAKPGPNIKPFGRCSHGGFFDFSSDNPAVGGINKDTSDCGTPHGHLHFAAAGVAKQDTKDFLWYVKKNVTLKQFKALLGIGGTLAFAIDTTGSMSSEIAGARAGATAIVNSRLDSDLEPTKYVLAEINDPTTNVLETDDPGVFLAAINGLTANDGDDCPELAFTAMNKALERFDDNSGELMVFTDATAKDYGMAPSVDNLAVKNEVKLTLVLSGSCSPIDPEYLRIARDTGGQVFVISETETFEATKLMDFTVRPDSVDIAHINGTLSATPITYTIPVDSTLTSVTFSVSGLDGALVKRPDGSTVQTTDPGVASANISGGTVLSITDPADGAWTVTVSGDGEFTIRVTGESPLRFSSFEVVELGGIGEHQGYFPIQGLPLAGSANKVMADLSPGDFTDAQFELRSASGALLQTLPLSEIPNDETNTNRQYFGDVTFPAAPVMVQVTGIDINGQAFQRVVPGTITAQPIQISASRGNEIFPTRDFSYTAQVTNHGVADTFKIEASDGESLIRKVSPSAFTLNTGQTIDVTVTVKAPADIPPGSVDAVTLSVVSTGASETKNFAVTELMIVPELAIGPESTLGGDPTVGTIRLFNGVAPEAGTVVSLSSSDTSVATVPATVTVQPGSRQESFVISTAPVSAVTPVTITASYGTVTQTAALKVAPADDTLVAVNLSEAKVLAGNQAKARVTLNGPAPAGGATVTLSSNSGVASVPASVTVPEGSSEGAFLVTTDPVGAVVTAQITATRNGISQSSSLRIYPAALDGISVSPDQVVGGAPATATISLRDPAPLGGATVTLESGDPSIVVPTEVTIPAGFFSTSFAVSTQAVTVPTSVAIKATFEGVNSSAFLRLTPGIVPSGLSLWPSDLTGGQTSTGTVTLIGPAPAGGTVVTLASSDPVVAVIAPTVTVTEGQTSATFSIVTTAVSSAKTLTVSASVSGVGVTKLFTVNPTSIGNLTLLPSSIGAGSTATGEVTLSNPAPAGGTLVSLTSTNTNVATVPNTVTVPGGAVSATFPIATLSVPLTSTVAIRATYSDIQKSATLTVFGANDVFATITADGPTVTVTTTNAGQNARVVFEGTAGQKVGLIMSGVTITSSSVSILKPDGGNLVSPTSIGTTGGFITSSPLSASGTYTILIDPTGSYVGSMTLKLINVAPDITGSITPGGPPVTVTTTTPGQRGLLTFSGTTGQRISLLTSGVAVTGGTYVAISINKPDNTTLVSDSFVSSSGSYIDVQTLPTTGTYTLVVAPRDTGYGTATLTLHDVPADSTANITPGGSPVTIGTTVPGQNALLSFNGAAAQRITLNISSVSLVGGNAHTDVTIRKPDGSTLATANFVGSGGGFINTQTLPVAGLYTILVNHQTSTTGSVTLTLNDVSADVSASIVPGGSPVTVTTTSVGQSALVTFDGNADQRVSLKISGVAMTGGNGYVDVSIKKPDGTNLVTVSFINSSGGFIDTKILPVTGTYTILVDPQGTNTGSATLTLYDVPADFTSSIVPGGSSVTATTTVPGQNAQLFFAGLANQRIFLKISGPIFTGGTNLASVTIKKPDGTVLAVTTVMSSTVFIDTQTLTADGAYTILIDPSNTTIGSATLTLYSVPNDLVGTITPGGESVTVTTSAVGQNANLTFDGTANQRVSLRITNVVLTGGTSNRANIVIKKPDGLILTSTLVDSGGGFIDTKTLPATGTYTLQVDPNDTASGAVTLTLFDVPADVTGSIVPGGSPVTVTTNTPGQNGVLTFSGVINQQVSLDVTGVTVTNGGLLTVTLRKPDGTTITSTIVSNGGTGFIDVRTLPVTGTYSLLVDPNSFNTATGTLRLYDVPADFATSTTINAAAVSAVTTVPGQNAKVTFAGSSSQQVTVRITNNTMGLVTVKLLKPDGSQQALSISSSASFNMTTQTLNATGTFTVSIDPSGNRIGAMDVRVTSP
jgi:hypothetical protein